MAYNDQDLEEKVKKIMRESLRPSTSSGENVFSRTQSLISTAIGSSLPTAGSFLPHRNTPNAPQPKRRSVPGHPYRFTSGSKKSKSVKSKVFQVALFPKNLDGDNGYRADVESELVSGLIDLYPDYDERMIRSSLATLFKTELPLIKSNDFEFVKRIKNGLSVPSAAHGFTYGFDAIKTLAGQGKLCCRLLVDIIDLYHQNDDDNDDVTLPEALKKRQSTVFNSVSSPLAEVTSDNAGSSNNVTSPPSNTVKKRQSTVCNSVSSPLAEVTSDNAGQAGSSNNVTSPLSNTGSINEHSYSSSELIDLTKENVDIHEIVVRRSHIRDDLIQEFEQEDILKKKLKFGCIMLNGSLERGQGDGVERDVISSFFNEFYESCCVGATEKVPIVRHDYQKAQWEAVARIVCHAIRIGYYPLKLTYAFMKSTFFGEDRVVSSDLLTSFCQFVSPEDKTTIERNLKEIDEDKSEIIEVLDLYKCHTSPTADSLENIVVQLAHKELIQKPKYIASAWSRVFDSVKFPISFMVRLKEVYKEKVPTGRKVVALFKCENPSAKELLCLEHLKTYTRNLSRDKLEKLLRFMTGSDTINVKNIEIDFRELDGHDKTPVFHTCGPVLTLPNTYTSYIELAEQFSEILNKDCLLEFDIV
ncbi:uncharacterized protein [Clytia hemisphaerica]